MQIQSAMAGIVNFATLGLANLVSSATTGKDLEGNNLNVDDAYEQTLETLVDVASLPLGVLTDGGSMDVEAVAVGAGKDAAESAPLLDQLGRDGVDIAEEGDEMTVEGQLQAHLKNAIENYQLSPAQERALINNPKLVGAFRGAQIDTIFKASVEADPFLKQQGIVTTPRGQFGPDAYNPKAQQWWDVTTPGDWSDHVRKYWQFGNGSSLFTQP